LKTHGPSTPLRCARDDRLCLLFRCDASTRIGTGHAMRCLALAQAWQDAGGNAVFAMAKSTEAVAQRIVGERMEFVRVAQAAGSPSDSECTIELAGQHTARWVVVDGYVFGADYQVRLHEAGLKVLILDDDGRSERYVAEIILNQNPQATERLYPDRPRSARLLLGSEYVLLRREFAAWRGWRRKIDAPALKVLVTMGGSDPDNVTIRVIEAMMAAPEFEAQIVVGGSNPHLAEVRGAIGGSRQGLRLVHNAGDMANLVAWADIAVAAAGTAAWEMAFMGLPALLIVLADNQEPIASALAHAGAAVTLGSAGSVSAKEIRNTLRGLSDSHEVLQKMSTCGRALVDGRGAERAVAAMRGRSLDVIQPVASPDAIGRL
jgi:UDP-2,4-diacetamido-2,4,6-trideoxy-beta-L-altropyranose hydrolase